MASTKVALIVGANRGIGLGVAKAFLAKGWTVIATARDPAKATALRDLESSHPGRVSIPRLDVNDPQALDAFAASLASSTLDAVLVNAGVAGPAHRSASAATAAETGALMFTNAIAPIRLARSLIDRIRPGSGVLAFTSSIMGSVALNSGGHELYRASKAALNSLTRGLWGEVGGRNLTVLTLHPGWVQTDMGGASATLTIDQSVPAMVQVIEGLKPADNGRFLNYDRSEIAW
jgi:NAD(P)-dependent dehydrogenase (short-subunit alcohol dehydrogenase family)